MPKFTMMVGNVGSGKSFFAKKIAKIDSNSVIISMDDIVTMLEGDYGRYDPNKGELYREMEETMIKRFLSSGYNVISDRMNTDLKRRERLLSILPEGTRKVAYDFGSGSEEGLKRRLQNNRGTPDEKWNEVFDKIRRDYVKPSRQEGFDMIVNPPASFKFYAFDFDGTIVKNKFPDIGDINKSVVDIIKKLYKNMSNIIIIWTCRSGNMENQARYFLLSNGIPFDFINENPLVDFTCSNKVFAHEYYDDRNMFLPEINNQEETKDDSNVNFI